MDMPPDDAPPPPGSKPGLLSTPPERRRGHGAGASVLCLAFAPTDRGPVLASGGEDGAVCLHDLRCPAAGPPAARSPGLGDPADGGDDDDDGGGGVAALAWSERGDALYASVRRRVLRLDARASLEAEAVLYTADDDVGGLALTTAGGGASALAVADDSGTVAIVRSPGGDAPTTHPCLPRAHINLASAVLGRPGARSEVLSGGFDCAIARWDATARRLIAKWDVGACVALADAAGGAEGGGVSTPTPTLNPPFVHALAAPAGAAAAPLSGLTAAALGDGSVLLLDADAASPATKPAAVGPAPGRPGARAVRKPHAGGRRAPDPRLPPGVLGALKAHARACTAVAFAAHSPTVPWLASGGDDGRLVISDWRAGCGCVGLGVGHGARHALWEAEVGDLTVRDPVLASVDNGRKIQAVAAGAGGVVAVGDMGRRVGIFRVVGC